MAEQAVLKSCYPYFIVKDLNENVAFFRKKLGFGVAFEEPDHGFTIVDRNDVFVLLRGSDHDPKPLANRHFRRGDWPNGTEPYDASIQVTDVEALHRELVARGADPTPVESRGYGRDTSITLPDGYHLVFLQFNDSGE